MALDIAQSAEIAAVVMQEVGLRRLVVKIVGDSVHKCERRSIESVSGDETGVGELLVRESMWIETRVCERKVGERESENFSP